MNKLVFVCLEYFLRYHLNILVLHFQTHKFQYFPYYPRKEILSQCARVKESPKQNSVRTNHVHVYDRFREYGIQE